MLQCVHKSISLYGVWVPVCECVCLCVCMYVKKTTSLLMELAQKPEFNLQRLGDVKLMDRFDCIPYLRQFTPCVSFLSAKPEF